MYDQWRLTVPLNTLITAPAVTRFVTPAGLLEYVTVEFPAGCHDMVNVQLLQGNNPIVPTTLDRSLVGNDVTLMPPVKKRLEVNRTNFIFRGWSPGTTYEHVITLGLGIFTEQERSTEAEYLGDIAYYMEKIGGQLGVPRRA